MPFQPGQSGNPKGRAKGACNKITIEIKALATAIVENVAYRKKLAARLKAGTAGAMEPLLWHYAYGKPKETVVLEDSRPLRDMTEAALMARLVELQAETEQVTH